MRRLFHNSDKLKGAKECGACTKHGDLQNAVEGERLEHPDILACKGLKKVIQEKTCLCEQQ
jgi:hypothetical protein